MIDSVQRALRCLLCMGLPVSFSCAYGLENPDEALVLHSADFSLSVAFRPRPLVLRLRTRSKDVPKAQSQDGISQILRRQLGVWRHGRGGQLDHRETLGLRANAPRLRRWFG